VTRDGRTAIVSDASIHRHKLHAAPTGWTKQGPLEFRRVMEESVSMIKYVASAAADDDDESNMDKEYVIRNEPEKIFKQPPHFTFDNYFVDDKEVLNLLVARGFGATMTHRSDRLPTRRSFSRVTTCVRRRWKQSHENILRCLFPQPNHHGEGLPSLPPTD
jgi:hypothetical protein